MSPMVAINLLPEKARRGEIITRYVALGLVAVAAVLAAFFALNVSRRATLEALRAEAGKLTAELNSPELQSIVKEVERFTQNKKNLDLRAETVSALRQEQTLLINILDILPDIMPAKASLMTMKAEPGKGGKKSAAIKLRVFAVDREIIPQFYENLANRTEVSNVSVDKVEDALTSLAGDFGHAFEVSFEVGG